MPEVTTLMTSLMIGESPRWHDGRLWFANWGAGEIIALDVDGNSEVVSRVPTTFSFCFDWLLESGPLRGHGRMLIVSGAEARLLYRNSDGSLATYADLSGLSPHPWNEIVVDGRGNAYVNAIGFDFPEGEFAPGIVALVSPDGSARQVAEGVAFPNGMLVTPDNKNLIVAESYGKRLTAFDIAANGDLSNRRVWADLGGDYPDGICLDADGAVWYASVPNKRCVRVRKGGEVLQTIDLEQGCFACMLGGADERTLFMLSAARSDSEGMSDDARTGQVSAVEAPAAGAGWPRR